MRSVTGDADAVPGGGGPSWRERRVVPRHPLVWVHVQGAWRKGSISAWVIPGHGTGWECMIVAEPTRVIHPGRAATCTTRGRSARGGTTTRPPDDPARAAGLLGVSWEDRLSRQVND